MDKITLKTFRKQFDEYIQSAESIVIMSHQSPDDDSISSVLSLYYWIQKKFPHKKVQVLYESSINQRWHTFAGFESIQVVDSIEAMIETIDLLIVTDANQYSRISSQPDLIKHTSFPKICIDHHKSQPDDWSLAWINDQATSTAEVIYKLFYQETDPNFAPLILLGILGDTGNLRFIDYKQADIYDIVKRLVVDGKINIQSFKSSYDYYSSQAVAVAKQLLAHQQTHQINNWPKLNITYWENQLDTFALTEVKEGVNLYTVTFGLIQPDVDWSVIIYATPNSIKISARSLPQSVNVRKLMEQLGIGSGHDRAAGGMWTDESTAKNKVDDLLEWLEQNPPILD